MLNTNTTQIRNAAVVAMLFLAVAPLTAQESRWKRAGNALTNIANAVSYVSYTQGQGRYFSEQFFYGRFGRNHEFRIDRAVIYGGHRRFQFAGVSFGFNRSWPSDWRATDALYVDYVGGSYMLCNRRVPGVSIPVNVESCESCGAPAPEPAPVVDNVSTLTRGQSIAEVVSILGNPDRALNLGAKQIYLYPNMKIVFINGRMVEAI